VEKVDALGLVISTLKDFNVSDQINLAAAQASSIKFQDLSLDSLDLLEYAMELEDAFEIEIEIEDIPAEATLGELAEHLLSLMVK